jgi:hypothetical protein
LRFGAGSAGCEAVDALVFEGGGGEGGVKGTDTLGSGESTASDGAAGTGFGAAGSTGPGGSGSSEALLLVPGSTGGRGSWIELFVLFVVVSGNLMLA